MVRIPAFVRMLDRKLLRDLWEMKGQSVAIAAVIAAGVTMFVMYLSNFDSLRGTRTSYYQSARFADVFASLKRAPSSLEARIAAIAGVTTVATRVVADVTLDVPGMAEPATGRLISLPERGRPLLNDVYLRRGRWVDPTRPDEVLASEIFCEAHGFGPGDRVAAIINGRKRWLTIVGVALSRSTSTGSGRATFSRTSAGSASSGWAVVRWPPPSTWRAGSMTSRSRSRRAHRSPR
jgi:putative ABC transport system permease protein